MRREVAAFSLINESFLTGLSWWVVSLAATTQMIIMRFNASELACWWRAVPRHSDFVSLSMKFPYP